MKNGRLRTLLSIAINGLLLLFLPLRADAMDGVISRGESASLRTFQFQGIVDQALGNPFGLDVKAGEPISGTLTYDAGAPGITFDPYTTAYHQSIVGGITALVGGRTYSSNNFTVLVENDRDGSMLDGYNADSNAGFNPSGDLFENGILLGGGTISVNALDFTGSLLSSQSLLDLNPTLFNNQFHLAEGDFIYVKASITLWSTPQTAVHFLMDDVDTLLFENILNQGQAEGLMNKLTAVIQNLNNGRTDAACNQLRAFIAHVNGLINAGRLSQQVGYELVESAASIRGQIGCSR